MDLEDSNNYNNPCVTNNKSLVISVVIIMEQQIIHSTLILTQVTTQVTSQVTLQVTRKLHPK